MQRTSIEWTHRPETGGEAGGFTWNPIRARFKDDAGNILTGTACTHASPGCLNCYAEAINKRFGTGLPYSVPALNRVEFFVSEKILVEPLRRKKPATIFVGDMFDLFHESIPDHFIDEVLAVMSLAQQHTFQLLTKRADRMRRYFQGLENGDELGRRITSYAVGLSLDVNALVDLDWPTPNLYLGTSVEDKKRAYERIPQLQMTPAAVRFLSIEPQLEEVPTGFDTPELGWVSWLHPLTGVDPVVPRIDWVICGGESGPGARPFNLAWAESLLEQCRAAGVPFFMKQIGSKPFLHRQGSDVYKQIPGGHMRIAHIEFESTVATRDRKGGNPAEWPEHLRVREFPSQKAEVVHA